VEVGLSAASSSSSSSSSDFDDLLKANASYAHDYPGGFDGLARAGVCVVTCMDSRIDPLRMLGLVAGDAKVLRNPGGRVTKEVLPGLVLAVHLLQVRRIMIVPHTRCAMVARSEDEVRERVERASGRYPGSLVFGAIENQRETLEADVRRVSSHPLIPSDVAVGGFIFDVDTGRIRRVV
jgi:carbonic anhydrase